MKETNIHSQTVTNKSWNPVEGRFDFSFQFAFHSREQYLEFRRCWKENYAALSRSIRGLKALIAETMRKHEYAGAQQKELHSLRAGATMQLLMLQAAKQEACHQYLAARQALK